MNLAIETNDLGKQYGTLKAVQHLSLRVAEGEIYAFLGLNGAGKTTTIRMLLGMIKPTTGVAQVLGTQVRPGRREPWAEVGYLVEIPHAYPELTVLENLEVARRLHPGTERKAVERAIERLGLAEYADRRAGVLSQGNAQRLGLAKALLHDPKLIMLDEPANGLDPAGIVEIRELLLELTREQGVTVFMSSHILAEVSRMADRIGIIHDGRLLQEMDVDELESKRRRRLLVRTRDLPAAREVLSTAGYPGEINPDGALELKQAGAIESPDTIAMLLVQAKMPPTHLVVEEEELEDYFLRLVGANGEAK
jgi:ABC-2 type transport system ATP-binding protein